MPPGAPRCSNTKACYGAAELPLVVPRSMQNPHHRGWQFSLMCCEPPRRLRLALRLAWVERRTAQYHRLPVTSINQSNSRRYVGPNLNHLSLGCYVLRMVRGRRNPSYYGLPERMRRARRRQDLGMVATSKATGKSTSSVFLIERRVNLPRINTIERFAATLGVSPSWLAYGEGPEDTVQVESSVGGLGQRLEVARRQRGLSRQALGIASGLTGQTVANIEVKGMMPRVDTVEMLARVLGVTAGWLAFGCQDTASQKNELVT